MAGGPTRESVTRRVAIAQAVAKAASRTSADRTYQSEIRHFRSWVESQIDSGVLPPLEPNGHIVTQPNVELYFSEVVANKTCQPQTAKRVKYSLDHYAKSYEGKPTSWTCATKEVIESLNTQRNTHYKASGKNVNDAVVLTSADTFRPAHMKTCLGIVHGNTSLYKHYQNYTLALTAGYYCIDSCLKLMLSSIRTRKSHGAHDHEDNIDQIRGNDLDLLDTSELMEEVKPDSKSMLMYVLRKLGQKQRNKRAQVVGFWRHQNWHLCHTGHLSFSILTRFSNFTWDEERIHFLKQPDSAGYWGKMRILHGWGNQQDAQSTYNAVYKAARIRWQKSTHMRTAGIEMGGAVHGLESAKLTSLSKHETDKFNQCYNSELLPTVLRANSGNRAKGLYIVPRSTDVNPEELADSTEITKWIWPRILAWRDQMNSPNGDMSAREFLYETLPFLAHVIIQDGIFWISAHPNHPYTLALRSRLEAVGAWAEYEKWAKLQRNLVSQIEDERQKADLPTRQKLEIVRGQVRKLSSDVASLQASISRTQTVLEHQEHQNKIANWQRAEMIQQNATIVKQNTLILYLLKHQGGSSTNMNDGAFQDFEATLFSSWLPKLRDRSNQPAAGFPAFADPPGSVANPSFGPDVGSVLPDPSATFSEANVGPSSLGANARSNRPAVGGLAMLSSDVARMPSRSGGSAEFSPPWDEPWTEISTSQATKLKEAESAAPFGEANVGPSAVWANAKSDRHAVGGLEKLSSHVARMPSRSGGSAESPPPFSDPWTEISTGPATYLEEVEPDAAVARMPSRSGGSAASPPPCDGPWTDISTGPATNLKEVEPDAAVAHVGVPVENAENDSHGQTGILARNYFDSLRVAIDQRTSEEISEWIRKAEDRAGVEPAAKRGPDTVKECELWRLKRGEWLNDEIINLMQRFLNEREKSMVERYPSRKPCRFHSTFFMTKLLDIAPSYEWRGYNFEDVKRWRRGYIGGDVFQLDKVFFPFNVENYHWILIIAFIPYRKIAVYDSGGAKYTNQQKKDDLARHVFQYLKDEHRDLKGRELPDQDKWIVGGPAPLSLPLQNDTSSCGVMTVMNEDLLSMGIPLSYDMGHVHAMRDHIALAVKECRITWSSMEAARAMVDQALMDQPQAVRTEAIDEKVAATKRAPARLPIRQRNKKVKSDAVVPKHLLKAAPKSAVPRAAQSLARQTVRRVQSKITSCGGLANPTPKQPAPAGRNAVSASRPDGTAYLHGSPDDKFATSFPETVRGCVEKFNREMRRFSPNGSEKLRKEWGSNKRQAFSKLKYLWENFSKRLDRERSRSSGEREELMKEKVFGRMEAEMKKWECQTANQYYECLKHIDPNRESRKKDTGRTTKGSDKKRRRMALAEAWKSDTEKKKRARKIKM